MRRACRARHPAARQQEGSTSIGAGWSLTVTDDARHLLADADCHRLAATDSLRPHPPDGGRPFLVGARHRSSQVFVRRPRQSWALTPAAGPGAAPRSPAAQPGPGGGGDDGPVAGWDGGQQPAEEVLPAVGECRVGMGCG